MAYMMNWHFLNLQTSFSKSEALDCALSDNTISIQTMQIVFILFLNSKLLQTSFSFISRRSLVLGHLFVVTFQSPCGPVVRWSVVTVQPSPQIGFVRFRLVLLGFVKFRQVSFGIGRFCGKGIPLSAGELAVWYLLVLLCYQVISAESWLGNVRRQFIG